MLSLLAACPCDVEHLKRVRRSPWMRALPWLRLYACDSCGKGQLRHKHKVNVARLKIDAQARFLKKNE
jgi:hypothetical protein